MICLLTSTANQIPLGKMKDRFTVLLRFQTGPIILIFFLLNGFGQLTRDKNNKIHMPQFLKNYILFTPPVSDFDNPQCLSCRMNRHHLADFLGN